MSKKLTLSFLRIPLMRLKVRQCLRFVVGARQLTALDIFKNPKNGQDELPNP
jgi:hypothetical protein